MTIVDVFSHKSASLQLTQWSQNRAAVSDLYSTSRGQGHATELMRILCTFADDRKLTLILETESYGDDPGLDNNQLMVFYAKFGFEILGPVREPILMQRIPSSRRKQGV